MNILPPLPPWEGFHPLIVHFPIALLLVAPLLMLLALVVRKHEQPLAWSALLLIALGTLSALIAVASGEAAGELAERNESVAAVLEHHEELAETARNVFIALTVLYALLLIVPRFFKKPLPRALHVVAHLLFLTVYLGGTILLARAAHEGGRLVHEFGVQSIVAAAPGATGRPDAALTETNRGRDDDD